MKYAFFGILSLASAALASELPPAAGGKMEFARDIEPIFTKHCAECHGEAKQKSGFRIDQRESFLKGGESGKPAIIPGKSAESHLIQLVGAVNAEEVMPPKGARLSPEDVGKLRAWVDQGASWPVNQTSKSKRDHWAFKTPQRPPVPRVKGGKNAIDAFVLARLQKEKVKPSGPTDKTTLLRRLSIDLIGLPPTPQEVDAFLKDKSPEAFSRQVERLLASPHYGERWGRHWLDAARYADSNGYEKDQAREAWHYRDWVIQSLNGDLPYDQFILQQIAGDLLPNATQDQWVATGFLRNSMINEEGAIDPEQFRLDAMFDRMDALGKSVLGLTIQCAQCHNHKYDPISQEEYYRIFAYINNDDELTAPFYNPEGLKKKAEVLQQVQDVEKTLQKNAPQWVQQMAAWEESVKGNQPIWTILESYEHGDPGGLSKLELQPDKSLLGGGHRFFGGTWRIRAKTTLTNVTGIRLELLTNGNLPMFGPGRGGTGMFGLKEITLEVAPLSDTNKKTKVTFAKATADFEQAQHPAGDPEKEKDKQFSGPVAFAIDGKDKTAWTVDAGPGRRNTDRKAVFEAATPFGYPEGTELLFHFSNLDEIASFRLSLTTTAGASADPLPKQVRDILDIPREKRTPAQMDRLFSHWRTTVPDWKAENEKIEALWKQYPEHNGTSLVLHQRPQPRSTRIFKRGDWLKPGKEVTPGTPAFLHPLPENAPSNRLGFAQWLIDKKSSTTARVMVNRVWQNYFGTGLVSTSEDLGTQSEPPSHPELLDWLACELMEPTVKMAGSPSGAGWSLKHLHRLIVHSSTYQQSSRVTPELYTRDQFNRLLARGPRFRVEGEIVRDIALASSGLLNTQVGGSSVYAPAPSFLFEPPVSYVPFSWKEAEGPERYRRALYTFRRRSTPYPVLQNFDTPNADAACVRRMASNTPLQALTTLNEILFLECARSLALKTLKEGGTTDQEKVTFAFRQVLSRIPSANELKELLALLNRQEKHLAEGWTNPRELATGTNAVPANLPEGVSPTQLATYTVISRVLLNLDETITKE